MAPHPVRSVREVGEYIREQRSAAQVSLRQLARLAGVSNPYLSQIERGLRKPSAEILQQIAKALRISAEQLYVQAGILTEREVDTEVVAAILADTGLSERQKQVLLEIYESFRRENVNRASAGPTEPADSLASGNVDDPGAAPVAAQEPVAAIEPDAPDAPVSGSVTGLVSEPTNATGEEAGVPGGSAGDSAAAPSAQVRSAS